MLGACDAAIYPEDVILSVIEESHQLNRHLLVILKGSEISLAKDKEKKIKEAAALQYEPGDNSALKIIALGRGEVAEKLIEKARESNVPLYENEDLAHTLVQMNLGAEIPRELYEVVAEILAFVSSMDKSYGEKYGHKK